ncbi:MAG TPA: hypothetical protein VL550_07750 [Rhodocyclaceae bacterium]|jgi:hypothetical protein|nr:hypothetical protein [Rhodocyclaceae bacterium]
MSTPDEKPPTVLSQADALMQRHRRTSVITGQALPGASSSIAENDDDLPVLTEVVDASNVDDPIQDNADPDLKAQIHAAIGANDAELARILEGWIASHLPHVLSQALDNVAEQLKVELAAKLRTELLTRPMFNPDDSEPGK